MFEQIISYGPLLLQGTITTILLWISSAIIGFSIGIIFGILNSKKFISQPISFLINIYVSITRGIPLYVQVLIFYFVLPESLGINLPASVAAIIALGLCSGGYVTEIIRGGINSIPDGQFDACYVLGYSNFAMMRKVIIPQAFKNILPSLTGELDQLIKSTSILSAIGVLELTRVGMNIISRQMNPITIYLFVALIYLCISTLLKFTSKTLEKRLQS